MSIALFGPDLPGSYQLGCVAQDQLHSDTGNLRFTGFLALLRTSDGALILADDMPVKIKPGWLKASPKDKFGDRTVTHGQAFGKVVPQEILTSMSTAMTQDPVGSTIAWRFYNHADPLKNEIWVNRSTVHSSYSYIRFAQPDITSWVCDDTYGTSVICSKEVSPGRTTYRWSTVGRYYNQYFTVIMTGDPNWDVSSGLSSTISTGSFEKVVYNKSGGLVLRSTSATTKFRFYAFTSPTNLSAITSQIVFAGSMKGAVGNLNQDLIGLSKTSSGNASWLSSYNAVESMKYLTFQWAAYLRDSYRWKELLIPLRKFSHIAKPRMWGELFLWWSYGVLPQTGDTLKLIKSIRVLKGKTLTELVNDYAKVTTKYGTSYSTGTYDNHSVNIKCNARVKLRTRLRPESGIESLFLLLQSFDVGIDATNIWELIPYSFVVDWFMNTGDFSKWWKSKNFPNLYDVFQHIGSQKNECVVPALRYGGNMTDYVTLTTYQRDISYSFPSKPFELSFTDPSGHWLEGLALLITRH